MMIRTRRTMRLPNDKWNYPGEWAWQLPALLKRAAMYGLAETVMGTWYEYKSGAYIINSLGHIYVVSPHGDEKIQVRSNWGWVMDGRWKTEVPLILSNLEADIESLETYYGSHPFIHDSAARRQELEREKLKAERWIRERTEPHNGHFDY